MGSFQYLKVLVMVVALIGVVYAIKHLNADSVGQALNNMGIEAGTPGSPGFMAAGRPLEAGEEHLNICPNRVQSVTFVSGGNRIEESARKWVAIGKMIDPASGADPRGAKLIDGPARELGYMEIEKWFSLHCQIVVRWIDGGSFAALSSTEPIEFKYIDGSTTEFIRVGGGGIEFSKGDKRFQSQDFAAALDELKRISQIQ